MSGQNDGGHSDHLLLNLRLTEHLWHTGNKPMAPNCYLRTQVIVSVDAHRYLVKDAKSKIQDNKN